MKSSTIERSRDYDYRFVDAFFADPSPASGGSYDVFTPEERRANLRKLANFLRDFEREKAAFNMCYFINQVADSQQFVADPDYYYEEKCGTAACALGWAPYATGVAQCADDFWLLYGASVLGVECGGGAFSWLFDSSWGNIDNSPEGAAWRIDYYLENGVPYPFSNREDLYWSGVRNLLEIGGYPAVVANEYA
jgi:hypothetical protein